MRSRRRVRGAVGREAVIGAALSSEAIRARVASQPIMDVLGENGRAAAEVGTVLAIGLSRRGYVLAGAPASHEPAEGEVEPD